MRHLVVELAALGDPFEAPLLIRPVTLADLDRLARLFAEAYRRSPTPEWGKMKTARREVERIFNAWDGPAVPSACLGAFDGERPVCACLVRNARNEGREGAVSHLVTAPAYQGRGLGRAVLASSLAVLRALGFERAFLDVTGGNKPAERLYESLGFVEAWRLEL